MSDQVQEKPELREFVHLPVGEEFVAVAGRYEIVKEEVLVYQDRPVLYLVGVGTFDASCCGAGGCGYAVVPGYLHQARVRANSEGAAVSLVSPIRRPEEKRAIEDLIRQRENLDQVNFL